MGTIQLTIVAVVAWFGWRTVIGALGELRSHPWHLDTGWLVAAGVFTLLGYLPAGLFWYRLLRVTGQDVRLMETLRAYYVGQLGKYVPGKFMVIVIRTGMIRSRRVDTALAVLTVFFETLTMMAVGGFLAAAVLAALFHEHWLVLLVGVAFMGAAVMPTLPPIFKRVARLVGAGRANPTATAKLDCLGYGTLLLGWAAMAVGWVFFALSLWAVLQAMAVPGLRLPAHFLYYLGSATMSKVAGFASLIPAGLGVADLTLTHLLHVYLRDVIGLAEVQAAALVAAVVLRLVGLMAEVAISIILYLVKPRRAEAVPEPVADESSGIGALR